VIPDPGNPQALDRFAYVKNNAVRYTDPTGHWYYDPGCDCMVVNKERKRENDLNNLNYQRKENPFDLRNSEAFIKPKKNFAVGFRVENTNWAFAGFDVNLDVLYFTESRELGIFTSFGAQEGAGLGSGTTTGFLYAENMPNRATYRGASWVVKGATIPIPTLGVSVEGDVTVNTANPNGTIPTTYYFGGGPVEPEFGGYTGAGTTVDWISIFAPLKDVFSGIKDLFANH
jgi:hypothetical protein